MTVVHIHSALLVPDSVLIDEARNGLSDDEIARSARFRSEHARRQFLLARWILRKVLAAHLGIAETRVTLGQNAFGKPILCGAGAQALEFNLSHSRDRLLISVCRDFPVGVDIEHIDPGIDPLALALEGLPSEDHHGLLEAPIAQRHELFFRCWTRWEAYLKALGEGFLHAGDAPSRTAGTPDTQLWRRPHGTEVAVCDLPVGAQFMAAVAVVGTSAFEVRWHEMGAIPAADRRC